MPLGTHDIDRYAVGGVRFAAFSILMVSCADVLLELETASGSCVVSLGSNTTLHVSSCVGQ